MISVALDGPLQTLDSFSLTLDPQNANWKPS